MFAQKRTDSAGRKLLSSRVRRRRIFACQKENQNLAMNRGGALALSLNINQAPLVMAQVFG